LQAGIVWDWETIPEYLTALDRRLGLNVAVFMGHSAIRQFVMGPEASERAARREEVERMRGLVQEGMAAGAFGITFNHNPSHVGADGRPVPSRLSSEEEMLTLVQVLADYDRGAVQIIGYPSQGIVSGAQEGYMGMARAAGRPILWLGILHQWQRPQAWRPALAKAEKIRESGLPVYPMCTPRTIDVLFTLTNAHIFDGFPAWKDVLTKSPAEVTAALRRPEVREALRQNLQDPKLPGTFSRRWDLVHVESAKKAENKGWEGRTVAAMAQAQGKDALDAFCDLALAEDLATEFTTVLANGEEGAVGEILQSPATVIGLSDAGAHAALECGYGFTTYLLGYWVREKKILSLEEAVRKLTSMPATILGLKDRGYIRPGLVADLVVFDANTVAALPPVVTHDLPAGEKRLVQKATGVTCTVVNGQMLTTNGEHTGSYPGRVLRS
jgi:N-acyl-D-aspartate/D-glutamate deacylase